MTTTLLQITGLSKRFGAVAALDGMDLTVGEGECVGVIGPNGSGKTTLFNTVAGVHRPSSGQVTWLGEDVTGWSPERLVRHHLARTFQSVMTFGSETALDNVRIAVENGPGLEGRTPADLLELCDLSDVAGTPAADLPYGLGRRLGIAVALAASPRLLMLDEPASGLNDAESEALGLLLRRIRADGVTLLVIDHDMAFLLPLVDRVVVLDAGRKLTEGAPADISADPRVVAAYLGTGIARTPLPPRDTESAQPGLDLVVSDLRAGYAAADVVQGVSFAVPAGGALAVLGPNGAGKTTLMRAIAGALPLRAGTLDFGPVTLTAEDVDTSALARWSARRRQRLATRDLVRAGLVLVPEGRHVIAGMSVQDNLLVAAPSAGAAAPDLDLVLDLFPALRSRMGLPGGALSGGQQQMLAIGRGLMARPRLLCLDEPSLGLSPLVMQEITAGIARLRAETGISLVIVEQSAAMALALSEEVYVMSGGTLTGPLPSDRTSPEEIMATYLGGAAGAAADLPGPSTR